MGEIVNFRFGADSSQLNRSFDLVRQNVDNLRECVANVFSVMGMDAVLGLFGKLRDVVGQLGQMFSSCMREAAALEEVGTRLGVMLNDAAGGMPWQHPCNAWLPMALYPSKSRKKPLLPSLNP